MILNPLNIIQRTWGINMIRRIDKKNIKKLNGLGNNGMGTVEIILIIVVLIGLVIIFRSQLQELIGAIFEKITADSSAIMA